MTNDREVWLPVVGYEQLYEVSNQGAVRRIGRPALLGGLQRGYWHVELWRKNRRKRVPVHRLALEAFVGPCPEGMEGCHNDGDSTNNRIENLRWDTSASNKLDIVKHGNHVQARKTRCPRGHMLEHPNLSPSQLTYGYRSCLACCRARKPHRSEERIQEIADLNYASIMAGHESTEGGENH